MKIQTLLTFLKVAQNKCYSLDYEDEKELELLEYGENNNLLSEGLITQFSSRNRNSHGICTDYVLTDLGEKLFNDLKELLKNA